MKINICRDKTKFLLNQAEFHLFLDRNDTETIEFFTLRYFWQNLAGSNKSCQIWQVKVSVEKSNILEISNRLEKSKHLENSYFLYFSNISYSSNISYFLDFPLNFNLKEENHPFCITF